MFLLKSLYYTVIISSTLDYLFQYLLQSFYYIFCCAQLPERVAYLFFADTCTHSVPIFDYSDAVWTCCNKTDADCLERLQRRAARIVCKSNCSDVALEHLQWSALADRRDMHVYKLVNKCLKENVPQFLINYFTFNRDRVSRRTRQSNLLYVPKVKLEGTKKSFFYNGCVVFNKLSSS